MSLKRIFAVTLLCLIVISPAFSVEPPFSLPKEVSRIKTAIVYTDYGDLTFDLFPESAPWHVANFKFLADKGFYKNSRFHIYQPGYIIQGGDPTGTGHGGPRYSLPPEFNEHRHAAGTLGMARTADYVNPSRDSHGSQFYITLDVAPHMNGQYTVFGQIRTGSEVLKLLKKDDRIIDVKVFLSPVSSRNSGQLDRR